NQVNVRIDKIEDRLSHLLGEGKADDIASAVEKQAQKWLEKKYGRIFERSFMMECDDGEIEEIDLYSMPCKKGECYIMAECTVSLISIGKVLKCVRKRNELAKKQHVDRNEIIVYIFALRIDHTKEQQILDEAKKHGVILRITLEESE
ncbi:hypothetical protein FO519_010320, partial [Halicephalobus sp. NKZ332]